MIGSAANGGSTHGWIGQFSHSWVLSHKQITRSFVYHLDQYLDLEINDCSNKVQTVFNRKIRKSMYSMVSTYTKSRNILIDEKTEGE